MKTQPAQILILDDESILGEMLAEMIQMLGHEPCVCQNPSAALALIASRDFDLILSDFHMPGMNGQKFYEELLARRAAMAGRVVFLTGDLINAEIRIFLETTGAPTVSKPFQYDRIAEVISGLLSKLRGTVPAEA